MEKVILFLFVFQTFNGIVLSQKAPKFDLTKDGIAPVVMQFDTSFSENLIYTRIKEWIAINNKSPQSVTRIDNPNSLIKFSCYKPKAWRSDKNGIEYWNELQYTVTVEIKKAKCRVSFATDETRYQFWYNDNGSLKDKFKVSEGDFERTVNETLTSLFSHIKSPAQQKTDEW